jgi:hypothetical protein
MVNKDQTSPSTLRLGEIWAGSKVGEAPEELDGLMLWVDEDGWLSSLEVVDAAEEHGEFNFLPTPSMCEPPRVGEGQRLPLSRRVYPPSSLGCLGGRCKGRVGLADLRSAGLDRTRVVWPNARATGQHDRAKRPSSPA